MEWISVKDRIPEDGVWVLCVDTSKRMVVAKCERQTSYYSPHSFESPGEWISWDSWHCCGSEADDPTHWMPLPEPPKE